MTKQERALKSLVNDIHKASKKSPYIKLWYPGYYPGDCYFVCDQVRILKCSYSEEYPLPSALADGVDEFDYPSYWKRYLNSSFVPVRLPSEDELKEAQQKFDDYKLTLPDESKYRDIKKRKTSCLWHFGGNYNYFNASYLRSAIAAMKEPAAFIDPTKKWSFVYIKSELEGTEILILPVNPNNLICNPFYRCPELEVLL